MRALPTGCATSPWQGTAPGARRRMPPRATPQASPPRPPNPLGRRGPQRGPPSFPRRAYPGRGLLIQELHTLPGGHEGGDGQAYEGEVITLQAVHLDRLPALLLPFQGREDGLRHLPNPPRLAEAGHRCLQARAPPSAAGASTPREQGNVWPRLGKTEMAGHSARPNPGGIPAADGRPYGYPAGSDGFAHRVDVGQLI